MHLIANEVIRKQAIQILQIGDKMKDKEARALYPILIVEDDEVTRATLAKTLRKAGYKVDTVSNGKEALTRFKKDFFPIILIDWVLPGLNGLEVCKAIRNDKSRGYVYIIFLTGKDSKDNVIEGLEAGADEYLRKPVDYSELIARLNTALRFLDLEGSLKRANEEVRIISITDSLTGCYNRTYMVDRLDREIKRVKRYKRPFSLILSDIDHFKKINDTYGHQVGDKALKAFADSMLKDIRGDVDWVARYGGEEFLVALPETDIQGAECLAERLRIDAEKSVVKVKNKQIKITASYGVTTIDKESSGQKYSIDDVINLADKYLYQAKREGRNRVVAGKML